MTGEFALTPGELGVVAEHARRRFPGLVPPEPLPLPFLDRDRARPYYRRDVPGAIVFASTGTSGYPKPIPWCPQEERWYVGEKQDLFAPWLRGLSRAFVSLAVGHNANSARVLLRNLGLDVHDAALTPLADQADALLADDPELIYASPSILLRLLDTLEARGRGLSHVRLVITNGEVVPPGARDRLRAALGLAADAVVDTYGSTEIGTIAATCRACGALHFLPGLFPEPVPPTLVGDLAVAAGPGVTGGATVPTVRPPTVLAVSSLKRTSFPVVRFVTYDVVSGLRRTRCGDAERFTIDAVLGRCDDILTYGELFSVHDLAQALAGPLRGRRWLVGSAPNDLTIVVEEASATARRSAAETRRVVLAAVRAGFPVHRRMIEADLLAPPAVHVVPDLEPVLRAAGLPPGATTKRPYAVVRGVPLGACVGEP